MAFSTTRKETLVKKGILKNVITMNDTAGNSQAMDLPDAVAITLQVEGTFASGVIKLQASNDGVTFYDTSVAATRSSAGIAAVSVIDLGFMQYRLNMASGGGTTALVCTVICKI